MVSLGTFASAHPEDAPCDFLTGGGFVFRSGAKANFGVAGGCKHGSPTWGHLEFKDHGTGVNVYWTTITAYFPEGATVADPRTQKPTGTRWICGTATTNRFGDVDFAIRATDAGEPGDADEFDLWLARDGASVYSTTDDGTFPHSLRGAGRGGGNIQLHKPNRSTTGEPGGDCPAYPFGEPEPEPDPQAIRFEDSAAAYAGDWHTVRDGDTGVTTKDGIVQAAFSAFSTASFSFSGSGVSWIGFPCEECGFANVYVDGALAATVDTFAPTRPSTSTVMFTRTGLDAGTHLLRIETAGSRNPSSAGAWVAVDAFDVIP